MIEGDESYISIHIRNSGIGEVLRERLERLARFSAWTGSKSPFTRLSLWRYDLTGQFNPVIAGEMTHELKREFAVRITEDGVHLHCYTGNNRLPFYSTGLRDGDYIDGVSYGKTINAYRKKMKNG